MTKRSPTRRLAAGLAWMLMLLPADGIGQANETATPTLASASLYHLESSWQTQHGQTISLASLGGRPLVLAMIYTRCEHACPRIIADLRRIRSELRSDGDRVGYVLVSLDPEHDDVARLAAFADEKGLTDWTLLHGEAGSVRELASALGVSFRRVGPRDLSHTNLLTVLEAGGQIVHQQRGLGVDPTETLAVLRRLLAAAR